MLGMSGATITVTKRGPGCREQGFLCMKLGTDVAPDVVRVLDDGYEMEYLHPWTVRNSDVTWELNKVCALLMERVWSRPMDTTTTLGGSEHSDYVRGWHEALLDWCTHKAPHLVPHVKAVYPQPPLSGYRLIHGDPTVANLMRRADGRPVLCDPLPCTAKIPSRVEVDLGKLLQSLCNWEGAVLGNAPPHIGARVADASFLQAFSQEQRRAAWLWCAIHLARAVPYCQRKGRHAVAGWAYSYSEHLARTELR